MNKNPVTAMIFGLVMVMGVMMVRAGDCKQSDPQPPPTGESQVKAVPSPTPLPSVPPTAGVVR